MGTRNSILGRFSKVSSFPLCINLLVPSYWIAVLACLFFTNVVLANLPSDPDLPIKHCYHWVKERDRKILTFKYNNAEKTGGEFSFYTDGAGGRAAGDGIYCSKTLIGSSEYGDRVIRIDFVEDIAFTNINGYRVCPLEKDHKQCNDKSEDVRFFNASNGWFVIRTPDAIESWTANDDTLKADLLAIQPHADSASRAKFQNTISLMEAEVQTKPKITYYNPKARMPFLKSIQQPDYLIRTASRTLIERLLKLSESELDSSTVDAMIDIVIKELVRKEQFDELPQINSILSKKPALQNALQSLLQLSLKPETISKFSPGTLVGIDSLAPDLITESDFQRVFESAFASSQGLDDLLKFASQSTKARNLLNYIQIDSDIVLKLRTKESQMSVLKILASRNSFENEKKSITAISAQLVKHLDPQSFADLVAEAQLLTEARAIDYIFAMTNQSAGKFLQLPEKHLQAVLTRAHSSLSRKAFENILFKLLENDVDWVSLAASLTESLPFSSMIASALPNLNSLFVDRNFSTTDLDKLSVIAIRIAFLSPKLSAKEAALYRRIFSMLLQKNACDGYLLEFDKFETAKVLNLPFVNLLKETVTELSSKKAAGLIDSSCNPVHYAHFMASIDGKVPPAAFSKLSDHFGGLKFPTHAKFDTSLMMKSKLFSKNSNLEWRLIEKIMSHELSICEKSQCDLSFLIQSYLGNYFKSRFDGEVENKTHSTSSLISRLTYFLIQKSLPSLAWISFNLESLYYSTSQNTIYPLSTYFALYSNSKGPADLKKKFETLAPYAMDSRYLELLIERTKPSIENSDPNQLKMSTLLLQKHLREIADQKLSYFKNSGGYSFTIKTRQDYWQRSRQKNFYCDYLSQSVYLKRSSLADIIKVETSVFQKSILEILERDCR